MEEMPLGIRFTVVFAVASRYQLAEEQDMDINSMDKLSSSTLLNTTKSPLDHPMNHQLYLVEERTATALKPTMLLVKLDSGNIISKTENLLQVLKTLSETGKDLLSAIADLNSTTVQGNTSSMVEKVKG